MTAPLPEPDINPVNKPWWDALAEGRLSFQRCGSCGNSWLPPRSECPACLADDWRWETASGRATLVSHVVYRTAYHEAFADRLPYNVAVVELDEGPRLISNILDAADGRGLRTGMKLVIAIEQEGATAVARFRRAP